MSTTEATTQAPADVVKPSVDVEYLRYLVKQIGSVDERISAASGSEAAIRNSVTSTIAAENSEGVQQVLDGFLPPFRSLPVEVMIGFMHVLSDRIEDEFGTPMQEYIDARVKTLSESAKTDVTPLKEQRKTLLDTYDAMKLVLETLGQDVSSVPEPKRRVGGGRGSGRSTGSTAARTGLNSDRYRYQLNGKNLPPSQNSLSSAAYYGTMGCDGTAETPRRWGVAQLKDFLKENGINHGKPGEGQDTFSIELPQVDPTKGKTTLSARRLDENNPEDKEIFDLARAAEKDSNDNDDEDNDNEETPSEETPQEPAPQEPAPQPETGVVDGVQVEG